jgi:hypothetical protein
MPEVPIPWPLTAHPGRRPGEGQGDLVNCFSAKVGESVMIRRLAGVEKELEIAPTVVFDTTPPDPPVIPTRPTARIPRGIHAMDQCLIHLWDAQTYILEPDGTHQALAGATQVTGSDRVTIASNQRPAGPQVVIVTDAGSAYVINMNYADLVASTISTYASVDTDLTAGSTLPTSVEYFSGYFVFTKSDGQVLASDLQTTAINALSTAIPEYSSDKPLRCINNGSTLLVMGSRSTEVWTDVGSAPFPFAKQTAIDVGLLGKWTVAGGANKWGQGVFFIANDFTVRFMDGYQPKIIGNDAVHQDIHDYRDDIESLNCTVYGFGEWSVFSISSPEWTWEYMANTGSWHRRKSFQKDYWRGRFSALWGTDWYVQMLGSGTDRPYTDNGGVIIDYTDSHGYLGKLDVDTHTEPNEEGGDPMRVTVESADIKEFPVNFRIPAVEIDVTPATSGVGTEAAIQVSWSHNGGATWSNPLIRSMGGVGQFSKRVSVRNLGRSTHHGVRFRLDMDDPVPFVLKGGMALRVQPSRPRGI